jgi:hypothetical protein
VGIGERAKQATEQARLAATEAAGHARGTAGVAGTQVREMAGTARRSLGTVVERIDPSLLADVIVKATAIQERTNAALRRKGSAYRIAEVTITATIPPQVGFSIARIGDLDDQVTGSELDPTEDVRIGRVTADSVLAVDADASPVVGDALGDSLPPAPLVGDAPSPGFPAPGFPAAEPTSLVPGQPVRAPGPPRFGPLWGPEVGGTHAETPPASARDDSV